MADDIRMVAGGRGVSRRELLAALGLGTGAVVVLGGCAVASPPPFPSPPPGGPDDGPFPDGVMAGEPAPSGAVIWTRTNPSTDGSPVPVLWTVAADATFSSIAAGGVVLAEQANGHSVSVPVGGLAPDRWYSYRFERDGVVSRTGRLRTAPAPGAPVDRLRFAFCGDQQINASWFVAHRAITREPDLDFFAHLGDYVYVNDTATLTVDDYRGVYRRWHGQPLLRDLHAALPVAATWSDGEFYNGIDRAGPPVRLANAKRAWFENFPVVDAGGQEVQRSFTWGALADLFLLDDRTHRDPTVPGVNRIDGAGLTTYDPTRTALGPEQYQWLTGLLSTSVATWRIIAQDYPMAPWRLVNLEFLRPFRPDLPPNAGLYVPAEDWDQYMTQRRDLLRFLADNGIRDNMFCAAETHIALASDLRSNPDDPASPVCGIDFTTPSLTADPDVRKSYLPDVPVDVADGVLNLAERWVIAQNSPDMHFMGLADQGYCVVDVDPERIEVTYRFIDTYDPDADAFDAARFRFVRGGSRMEPIPVSRPRGSVA